MATDSPITASWLSTVMPRRQNLCEHRPCILCGDTSKVSKKTVPVDTVLEHLDLNIDHLKQNHIWKTVENVCLSAIAVQQQQGIERFSESVALCLSCSHWSMKKKKANTAPLVQFKWHIRTLMPLNGKRFDKRSVHRIATVLSQPENYYRTLFTRAELKCVAKMKNMQAKDVNRALSKHFKRENMRTLFVEDSSVAEMLRS